MFVSLVLAVCLSSQTRGADTKKAVELATQAEKHILNGDYDRAITDCTKAIRLDPNAGYPYVVRSKAYQHQHKYKLAVADCTKLIQLSATSTDGYTKKFPWDGYTRRAFQYMQMKEYDRAIADYSEAIQIRPSSGFYERRAKAYERKGDLQHALADTRKAKELLAEEKAKIEALAKAEWEKEEAARIARLKAESEAPRRRASQTYTSSSPQSRNDDTSPVASIL